ncbi:MAG: hypothetical protein Tsb005_10310 [Gammaproteobacteria bacterium]
MKMTKGLAISAILFTNLLGISYNTLAANTATTPGAQTATQPAKQTSTLPTDMMETSSITQKMQDINAMISAISKQMEQPMSFTQMQQLDSQMLELRNKINMMQKAMAQLHLQLNNLDNELNNLNLSLTKKMTIQRGQ